MNLRGVLQRTNLALGLVALGLALWAGIHLQHLLDDAGSRHSGETVVMLVLALSVFTASRYGARLGSNQE